MKAMIIDDDITAMKELAERLKAFDQIEVCGMATTGEAGIKMAKELCPELLFLDVELPDMSGIEYLSQIQQIVTGPCQVVMYTAHSCYMLPSFRNNAFDFLTKPIDDEELKLVVSRVLTGQRSSESITIATALATPANDEKMLFYTNSVDFRLVHIKDIGLFQYNHELRIWEVVVACCKEPIRLKRNVNNETLLALDSRFVQVSQRYIINVNYLLEVVDNICRLYPPFDKVDYVKVGRLFRRKLIERFNSL